MQDFGEIRFVMVFRSGGKYAASGKLKFEFLNEVIWKFEFWFLKKCRLLDEGLFVRDELYHFFSWNFGFLPWWVWSWIWGFLIGNVMIMIWWEFVKNPSELTERFIIWYLVIEIRQKSTKEWRQNKGKCCPFLKF